MKKKILASSTDDSIYFHPSTEPFWANFQLLSCIYFFLSYSKRLHPFQTNFIFVTSDRERERKTGGWKVDNRCLFINCYLLFLKTFSGNKEEGTRESGRMKSGHLLSQLGSSARPKLASIWTNGFHMDHQYLGVNSFLLSSFSFSKVTFRTICLT